eukprot:TRINITY_DN1698_c0_g1_i1.p1 TRINITY_DN1698_c0_g1~~TRINITY_DN1698_c0_g1_i1.p1  ORF type:complete len:312 (+),score=33.46 TRINITY_DN1698_c0_g1_i1:253-1188(+)
MGMRSSGLRFAMYTDDTNSTLALASSLLENNGLLPIHAAHQYGRFWQTGTKRGYPSSAQDVMKRVLEGEDIEKTGTSSFPQGSYANGGAMRISPVGIAFRNADDETLHEAVRLAIISSHVHPEAIDGAWLQAKAISMLSALTDPSQLTPDDFLTKMKECSRNDNMKKQIDVVKHLLSPECEKLSLLQVIRSLGEDFQIRTVDAVGTAFYNLCKFWNDPEECIIHTVLMGGDADTTASIVGALCGALHGAKWIPFRWWKPLENGIRGRDYALQVARELSKLDCKSILVATEEEVTKIKEESAKINVELTILT